MKSLDIFNKNTEICNIVKRFDDEHGSIFYNIFYELDFNTINFILNILPRFIKSRKYPFTDMCHFIQKLFLMMKGYKNPSNLFDNILDNKIEAVFYLSSNLYEELKKHDIYSDGINWDNNYKSCIDTLKLFSNWSNILTSYIEEQDYIKETENVKQVVLCIPLNECIIVDMHFWDILVRDIKSFIETFTAETGEVDYSEFLENFIIGLDLVKANDIVVLTDCIKKDWLKGGD